jgi:hypothetical protein
MHIAKQLLFFSIWGLAFLPNNLIAQCTTNIAGEGIGLSVACTSPNAYSYSSATYSSTVTQSGWSYTWSVSPNGTITYGQGSSQIGVWWNSAPSGLCASWVNLEVSNGSGCIYNYGIANGVAGKCVNVQTRPSPNFTGDGMPNNYTHACKYYPALNNLETYTITTPCTGCNYSWAVNGGSIVTGQ